MRCIAGALALMMAVSLHAAPEDVLAPEYAREEGWQWLQPQC
ncbi:IncF plasmid conjugative transfer pilus assembly protein TraF [Salmonella enterica subsp. arizonae]|uniref:IncF plasmid conjugative transfer pilus assembly protein TraF n=1 Tax=Salmonella enterica subsp. arizonae TaxID=59203 RepID=A0A379T3L9_SALER|nr:IncF plasmid conjugative transfer pilus assembly protein TraF [Salmonella enterica subsp. arizonae]